VKDNLSNAIISVVLAIIGIATISVILSRQANTAAVITAAGNALSNALKAATSPIGGLAIGSAI